MIIHDYDPTTKPLINMEDFYSKQKKVADKCIIIFSTAIRDCLLSAYACSVIGESDYDIADLTNANHDLGKVMTGLEIVKRV